MFNGIQILYLCFVKYRPFLADLKLSYIGFTKGAPGEVLVLILVLGCVFNIIE